MCESCPSVCLCVDVDKLLKSGGFDILACIFQVGKSQPGFELCKLKKLNCAQFGFLKFAQFRFLISDNLPYYLNTIALRATLPCRCNLVLLKQLQIFTASNQNVTSLILKQHAVTLNC